MLKVFLSSEMATNRSTNPSLDNCCIIIINCGFSDGVFAEGHYIACGVLDVLSVEATSISLWCLFGGRAGGEIFHGQLYEISDAMRGTIPIGDSQWVPMPPQARHFDFRSAPLHFDVVSFNAQLPKAFRPHL